MPKLIRTIILLTLTTHQLKTQGLQNGDQRYLANDSYVGREISCSEEEKICLTFGLLYDAEERRCKKLGDSEVSGSVSADISAFSEGSLRATRRPEVPCPRAAPEVRMAFDGGCRDAEALCGALCPEGRPALNLFGGWECRCSRGAAAVRQPLEAGRCAVPRFGDHPSSASRVLQCSRQQRECFTQGKVRFRSGDACHELLQRGPCPENHILALSEEAADGGSVEVICVRNPCGPGKIRTSSDGHCYDRQFAENLSGNLFFSMNVFGYEEPGLSNGKLYVRDTDGVGQCVLFTTQIVINLKLFPNSHFGKVAAVEATNGGHFGHILEFLPIQNDKSDSENFDFDK